ncbi:hypothetical protein [Eubacterium sp.]
MKRNLKKIISMLLVLTMIFTSITVSNTTAKAAGEELVQLTSSKTSLSGQSTKGTVAWVSSDTVETLINKPHEFCGFLIAGTDHDGWGRIGTTHPLYGKGVLAIPSKWGDTASMSVSKMNEEDTSINLVDIGVSANIKDETGNAMFGGDCIAIDESLFDIGDSEQGTFKIKATSVAGNEVSFSVIVKKYEHIANYKLNLHQTEGQNAGQANFRFDWDKIDGAAKYKMTSINADGTKAAADWEGTNLYQWYAAITTETEGETYTVTVAALDNDGNTIKNPDGEDVTESITVNKRYVAPSIPDLTQDLSEEDKATLSTIVPEEIAEDKWTELKGPSNNGSKVYASSVDNMGNVGLRGFYNDGNPDWNRGSAVNFKTMAVFGFVTTGANATSLIFDDKEYINPNYYTNEKVFVGGDCVYINQELVEAGVGETQYHIIWAKGSNVAPFAIKVVGPSKAIDPDAPAKPVGLVVSETNPYYYSWGAVECDYYNIYVDDKLVGESTNANYDVVNYLSDNNFATGTYKFGVSVVKDGHESEITEADLIVTTVNVTIGEKVTSAVKGGTFTFPTDATGYELGDTLYAPGEKYTVTDDVTFEAVNVTATMGTGAGIRFDKENPGLRFQTTITVTKSGKKVSDTDFAKYVSAEGTLITTKGLLDEKKEPTIGDGSTYTVGKDLIQIANSGWYKNQTGVYYGSVVKINDYATDFVARAYVTVKYTSGEKNIYSEMSDVRAIKTVAQNIQSSNAEYKVGETSYETYYKYLETEKPDYKKLVDEFAGTTEQ